MSAGREQMEVSFGYNYYQLQYRYLAHGVADWVTRGIHLGYWRNYLTVDSDDVFNADAEWSQPGKCTPNDSTCPPGTPATTPSRMTPADVTFATSWQNSHDFKLEFLYNGGASSRFQVNGTDPLLSAIKPVASSFWWVNHTYTHQWLGCVQDFTVTPWRCATDGSGTTQWVDAGTINGEITNNITWAKQNGIPIEPDELAPGEYSGLRILPQQPVDNPNLVQAIASNGIRWVPLDASREPAMRPIGSALGVPRHPIDVFYNVSTKASEVSEYNWIYDSAADGGSGLCTAAGTSCLGPLSLKTGWDSIIAPRQITTMLTSAVQNDPRPFMFHQSNLTSDRLLYPVVSGVLSSYRAVFAGNAPIVNQRLSAAGAAMHSQDQWAQASAAGTVSGYVQGSTVTISGPSGTSVPVTAPNGTKVGTAKGAAFGSAYGGELSAYTTLIAVPIGVAFALGINRWRGRVPSSFNFVMILSFVVPELIFGVAMFFVFTQLFSGIKLGLLAEVLGLVTWNVSWPAILVQARLAGIGRQYEEAAADLGATQFQTMRRVLLPLLAPAIFASAILVFSGVIDDFVIVDLLSSNGSNTPMSVIIYSTQHGGNGGPALNALATIMLVFSFVVAAAGYAGYRFMTRGERIDGRQALATIAGAEG